MILFVNIVLLIVAVGILFWQGSLIYAQILGAPTVYANSKAISDALTLAGLKEGDTVLDLGCGNARSLIIAAEKFQAYGVGVERSPFCFLKSKWNVFTSGQSKKIKIIFGDFRKGEQYLKKADVVYLYLLNSVLKQIEEWVFSNLKKDSKIVSLAFSFPGKKVSAELDTLNLGRKCKIRLYMN